MNITNEFTEHSNIKNITIVGCGNGGQAIAAHLTYLGYKVTLYAPQNHASTLNYLMQNSEVQCCGELNFKVKIHHVTSDMKDALNNAKYIFLCIPGFAHDEIFNSMYNHLNNGQVVCTFNAHFSALFFYNQLLKQSNKLQVTFVDFNSLPYACRAESPGKISIIAIKKMLSVAMLPRQIMTEVLIELRTILPLELIVHQSVIKLGLTIPDGITHPINTLLNAGRIGNGNLPFYFYKDGISEKTATLITEMDKERQHIGKLCGFEICSYVEMLNQFYGTSFNSIYDFFTQSAVHNEQYLCPNNMNDRYIEQDVPYILVPWFTLGLRLGYEAKVMSSIINLSSLINQKDYLQLGRSLKHVPLLEEIYNENK
ncbi:hypothetical protein D5R81_04575 [Parashewanella spongiae]|uniref:NAD/NADP octopine/nopaline dehydrogenase n=1 Tax=Parashewanella spongiae TaxID=342950 RepID=A0A3A6UHR4_9GAMM|nr:NAD/NADP-dependent octopine/nopaline dehydrogenase family protein [Parashewanella spongiae]MCL1077323.1 NAD/NADP octopine/nopaline dehydrogenase family protein [Parashewanella spongiae]RJY18590.1 hypothetical protein D5R81_04575 [Parashewanella spongiae]